MATATKPKSKAKIRGKQPTKTALPSASTEQTPVAQPLIAPMAGESQSAFFDRANRALRQQIPSINRRTVEILKIWKSSPNDVDLREKASRQFPEGKYQHFGPRCVFLCHTVPSSGDGKRPETKYGRAELEKLVDWANYRIRNNDTFSAISDGHTPTPQEKASGRPDPDVLGYAGPFYLGLLGDVDPKFAIYADEWVHTSDVERFEKLQRRSPEVWCLEPIERRTLDPIAALGAETPRLDVGMNPYARFSDGVTVLRYSAVSAALPGPSNTFIPGGENRNRKTPEIVDYGATQMPQPMNPNLDPSADPTSQGDQDGNDMGQRIQDAVFSAIEGLIPSIMQSVASQLGLDAPTDGDQLPPENSEGAGDPDLTGATDEGDGVPRGMQPSEPAPKPDPTAVQSSPVDAGAGSAKHPNEKPGNAAQPPADLDDDEKRQYSAMSPDCQTAYMAGRTKGMSMSQPRQNYSRSAHDEGLHAKVAQQQAQINNLVAQIEQRDRDVLRYSRLSELSKTFVIDSIDDEMAIVADFSDDQFERHCDKTITRYARRDAVENHDYLPDPMPDSEVERYGRRNGDPQSARQVAEIERYSRQAQQIAIEKNFKAPGSTTFAKEFDALCKANGINV